MMLDAVPDLDLGYIRERVVLLAEMADKPEIVPDLEEMILKRPHGPMGSGNLGIP